MSLPTPNVEFNGWHQYHQFTIWFLTGRQGGVHQQKMSWRPAARPCHVEAPRMRGEVDATRQQFHLSRLNLHTGNSTSPHKWNRLSHGKYQGPRQRKWKGMLFTHYSLPSSIICFSCLCLCVCVRFGFLTVGCLVIFLFSLPVCACERPTQAGCREHSGNLCFSEINSCTRDDWSYGGSGIERFSHQSL